LILLCFVGFMLALLASLSMGRYPIGLSELARLILPHLGLGRYLDPASPEMQLVFWNIRVPRVLMSIAVGSGISIAGVVFQALFRNPLAAPDILGVTAGSCFGAALSIMFFTQLAVGVQGFAFVFGVLAVSIAYLLAERSWDRSTSVLVITGIVISAVFQAGVSILMYLADPYDQLAKIVFWIMGSFHVASWAKVQVTLPVVVAGSILLSVFSWRLNIMTQSEEEALSLGVDVFRWRLFYVVTSHADRGIVGGRCRNHQLGGPHRTAYRPLFGRHRTPEAHTRGGVYRRRFSAGHGYRCPDHLGLGDSHQHHHLDHRRTVPWISGDAEAQERVYRCRLILQG